MAKEPSSIKPPFNDAARARLAAIVDFSDDAIVSATLEGVITSWNQGAERLYGYSAREAIGRHAAFYVPEERLDELRGITEKLGRGERVEHLETERLAKDGRRIPVSLTISPVFAADGTPVEISAISRDISDRKRMERSLRESEERYRTLVEMAPDAVVVHQDSRFVYVNCAALGIFGARSLQELQRFSLPDLIHPEERQAVLARIRQLLDGEEIPLREYRLVRLNGEEISVEASSTLIDYQGKPSIQSIARDITHRKRAEQERERVLRELALERARFETVVRQIPLGLVIAEAPAGRVIYENEQAREIFRRPPHAINALADYGAWRFNRLDGSPLGAGDYPLSRAVQGETVSGEEFRIERGDGSRGFVRVNATPVRDASGEVVSGIAVLSDVTREKEAFQALRDSEQRLNLALEAAEMGSCDMEVESGEGLWSRRHFLLLGYEAPGGGSGPASIEMWQSLIHPEDGQRVRSELERARREPTLFRSEHRIVRIDNAETVWVNVQGRFICDLTGTACRFIGVLFDVTERRNAEELLRRSEKGFRMLADSMPQIAWTAAPDGSVEYLNAHFEIYTGLRREAQEIKDNLGHPERLIAAVVHPEDSRRTEAAWRRAIETGAVYQEEARVRRADGAYRWHLSRAVAEQDEEGKPVRWYGTATDIHDLRETQEKLRASENKFRWLYESNLIAIFFWREDGTITEANDAFCELVGYSMEECRSGRLSWLDATPSELFPRDFAAIEEVLEHGICKPYQKLFVNRRDGRKVPVLIAVAAMVGGEAQGIAFVVDLTELKRTEQALKKSQATLKIAIETTGLGIFDLCLRTGKGYWSDIAKRHYGLPPDAEADLTLLMQGVHPEDRERIRMIAEDAAKPSGEGEYGAEYRTVGFTDGRVRWLTMRARVARDEEGVPVRLVGACLDITEIVEAQSALKEEIAERLRAVEELRKQEQLLIRQGRLAAMGEMIGNIAHQWRQPLNTLGLIVQELPRYYEKNLFSKEYLEQSAARAMQVINYMSKTIDGFRNFFGPDKEKQEFRAGEVLARTISIVEAPFNELSLKIEVSLEQDSVIYGCPNEYSQVILNILVNAKDALLERKVEHPLVSVRLFREDGKTVLTIADNAGGIDPGIVDKIFDPYFTTKAPDKGTGIGLFMSRTIIEKNMKGLLTVRNTEHGAEFRIEV